MEQIISTTSIILFLVLVGIILVLFFWIADPNRCTICGRIHRTKDSYYTCERCGKAFCKEGAGVSERSSLSQSGPLTHASIVTGSSYYITGKSCGVVETALEQGVSSTHYFCRKHIAG